MNFKAINAVLRKNPQWPLVMEIARQVKKSGGRALVVGGAVRDALINVQRTAYNVPRTQIKDFDLEVYGISKSNLKRLLLDAARGTRYVKRGLVLKEVGKQFGVFNLGGVEVAIPRTDSRMRSGMGRKPKVISEPRLSFEQASKRRDVTINAMAYDPLTNELMDVHGGQSDLRRGILRAVDEKSFGDDPLRVLRVMQFAGRFGFKVDQKTVALCRKISLKHLVKERVGEEWTKLLFKAPKPSVGLEAGRQLGIFAKLHPELARMSPADWKATKLIVDRVSFFRHSCPPTSAKLWRENPEKVFKLIALCHRMRSASVKAFLKQINSSGKEAKRVLGLLKIVNDVKSHKMTNELVRRIAHQLSQIDEALSLKKVVPFIKVLVGSTQARPLTSTAKKLHVFDKSPINLLTGQDLLLLGVRPGKQMGELLKMAFDRQLKGEFDDKRHMPQKEKALAWVASCGRDDKRIG